LTLPVSKSTARSAAPSVLWKVFDVLGAFRHRHRVLTLAQIVRHTGMPKSTVHRVLAMLADVGAVELAGGGYRIGLRMFTLGALPPACRRRSGAASPVTGTARGRW